jgi:hypothetical protein
MQPVSQLEITRLLQRVPCSLLQSSKKEGAIELRGFVREDELEQVKADLATLAGVSEVKSDAILVGDEQCDALEVLSPYWRSYTLIRTKKSRRAFVEGESLVLDITTPPFDSYVNVDYFSLGGGVLHMVPSPRVESNQAPANHQATIGDLGEWIVSEPFGTEMIAIVVTPEPLFPKLRDEFEAQAKYLPELQRRLQELDRRFGSERIAANFLLIRTSSKPGA